MTLLHWKARLSHPSGGMPQLYPAKEWHQPQHSSGETNHHLNILERQNSLCKNVAPHFPCIEVEDHSLHTTWEWQSVHRSVCARSAWQTWDHWQVGVVIDWTPIRWQSLTLWLQGLAQVVATVYKMCCWLLLRNLLVELPCTVAGLMTLLHWKARLSHPSSGMPQLYPAKQWHQPQHSSGETNHHLNILERQNSLCKNERHGNTTIHFNCFIQSNIEIWRQVHHSVSISYRRHGWDDFHLYLKRRYG